MINKIRKLIINKMNSCNNNSNNNSNNKRMN